MCAQDVESPRASPGDATSPDSDGPISYLDTQPSLFVAFWEKISGVSSGNTHPESTVVRWGSRRDPFELMRGSMAPHDMDFFGDLTPYLAWSTQGRYGWEDCHDAHRAGPSEPSEFAKFLEEEEEDAEG